MTRLRQAADRYGGSFSSLSTDGARRLPARAVEWFRNLPGVPKLVIVGLVLPVLLIPLSPVAAIICALLLGVSIIALTIRVVQKKSVKNWGIVAVASVVLMFTFDRISDALLLVFGLVMAALPVVYLVLGGPQRIREKISFLTALLTDPSDPRVVKYRQEKANEQERKNRQLIALRHRRQQTNYTGTGKAPGLGAPDSSRAPMTWGRQAPYYEHGAERRMRPSGYVPDGSVPDDPDAPSFFVEIAADSISNRVEEQDDLHRSAEHHYTQVLIVVAIFMVLYTTNSSWGRQRSSASPSGRSTTVCRQRLPVGAP